MSVARVSLTHENVAYAGVIAFDGEVLEILGFADTASHRMPIELIDEVEVSARDVQRLQQSRQGGLLRDPAPDQCRATTR